MSSHHRSGRSRDDDDTDDRLLCDAQHYLQSMLRRVAPDSFLTERWDHFFHKYDGLLRYYARECRVPTDDLEDCVQDTWSKICVKLPQFRYTGSCGGFRAWLHKLIHDAAVDQFRRQSRRRTTDIEDLTETIIEPADPRPGPAAEFDRSWESAMLRMALDELKEESPTSYREVDPKSWTGGGAAKKRAGLGSGWSS